MVAVLLHNLYIHTIDPSKPRWEICVENLEFTDKYVCRKESTNTKKYLKKSAIRFGVNSSGFELHTFFISNAFISLSVA